VAERACAPGMQLVCVPPDEAARAWPHVRALILAAMKRGGLSSYGPVEDAVLRGDALLWLAWEQRSDVGDQRTDLLPPASDIRHPTSRIAAAAVTELHQTEWRKVCVLIACGGASGRSRHSPRRRASTPWCSSRAMGARNWIGLLDEIEAYARAAGCEAVRLMGREGWQRLLPSYRRTGIVLERTL
jgi:hypothetical protein